MVFSKAHQLSGRCLGPPLRPSWPPWWPYAPPADGLAPAAAAAPVPKRRAPALEPKRAPPSGSGRWNWSASGEERDLHWGRGPGRVGS